MIKKIMILVCLLSASHMVSADTKIQKINFIRGENVNVRMTPEIKDNIAFVITSGWKAVVVLNKKQGVKYAWSKIQLKDKREGWVISPLIDTLDTNNKAEIKLNLLLDLSDALAKNDFNKNILITEFYTSYLRKHDQDSIDPLLFFYEKEDDNFIWKTWNARTNKTISFYKNPKPIDRIYYDHIANTVYFERNKLIFSVTLDKPGPPIELGAVPKCEGDNLPVKLKIKGDWWISPNEIGTSIYNVCYYEYSEGGGSFPSRTTIGISELNVADGKWAKISPTTFASRMKSTKGKSLQASWTLEGQYGYGNGSSELPDFAKTELPNFNDSPEYIKLTDKVGVLFSSNGGEPTSLSGPVMIVKSKDLTYIDKGLSGKWYHAALFGSELLISEGALIVYNIKTSTISYQNKNANFASWFGNATLGDIVDDDFPRSFVDEIKPANLPKQDDQQNTASACSKSNSKNCGLVEEVLNNIQAVTNKNNSKYSLEYSLEYKVTDESCRSNNDYLSVLNTRIEITNLLGSYSFDYNDSKNIIGLIPIILKNYNKNSLIEHKNKIDKLLLSHPQRVRTMEILLDVLNKIKNIEGWEDKLKLSISNETLNQGRLLYKDLDGNFPRLNNTCFDYAGNYFDSNLGVWLYTFWARRLSEGSLEFTEKSFVSLVNRIE